jgi:hypothetical protein
MNSDLLERSSACSCAGLTPPLTYGAGGWHWRRSEQQPANRMADVAYERCPAYAAAVRRRRERERR